jgi:hypothetical protein
MVKSSFMTETRKDAVFITTILFALCVEAALLMAELRIVALPLPWIEKEETRPPVAKVIELQNQLSSRHPESFSWYPVVRGNAIVRDDSVMTGPDSWAKIELKDGGELEMQPETLVRFSRDSETDESRLAIFVDQGILHAKTNGKPLQLSFRKTKLMLARNSEAFVTRRPIEAHEQVNLKAGEAKIVESNSGKSENLVPGDTVNLDAERNLAKVEAKLSFEPEFPASLAQVLLAKDSSLIHFRWKGAAAETIEIDSENTFLSPKRAPAKGHEADVEIGQGHFYWRIVGDNAVSLPSEFYALRSIEYKVISPPLRSVVKGGVNPIFEWPAIEDAKNYEFELATDPEFTIVLFSKTTPKNRLELAQLPAGQYYWHYRAKHAEWGSWPFSEIFTFNVKAQLAPPKVKGMRVLKNKSEVAPLTRREQVARWLKNLVFPTAYADEALGKTEALFEWEPSVGAKGYRFELSEDSNFENKVIAKETKETSVVQSLALSKRWYWRVASRDTDGDLGIFTRPQSIQPATAPKIKRKREVASLGSSRITAPPPPTQIARVFAWRFGLLPTYRQDSVTGPTYGSTSGTFYPTYQIGATILTPTNETEVRLGLAMASYDFNADSGMPRGQFNFDAPYLTVLHRISGPSESIPLVIGGSIGLKPSFIRNNKVGVVSESIPYASVLFGPSLFRNIGRTAYLKVNLFVEAAPIGQMRSIGLWSEATFGLRKLLGGLTPEIYGVLSPSYYTITYNVPHAFGITAMLGFQLRLALGL